jgi:hypothetical protein
VAIVVEHDQQQRVHPIKGVVALGELGWLAIAGGASLGAGAIHAAAIGVHSEHRSAVVAFTIVAAIQLGWGAIALARPGRILLSLGILANAGIFAGWVLAKTNGISFIGGMEEPEAAQMADAMAAGLAVVAVLGGLAYLFSFGNQALVRSPLLTGIVAIAVAGLAVPAMLSAGSHAHASGSGGDHHASGAAAADDHGDDHDDGEEHANVAVPPKAFDPALPIDLGGVEGVSLEQQARAENLLAITLIDLPQFSDPAAIEAMGFVSIGDGFTGHEHYLNAANMNDDRILDPDYPESLVFDTTVEPKRLAAAMFMLNPGDTLDDVPDVGGALTQWHIHNNLCFAGPRVAGLTDAEGNCPSGLSKGTETPMMHVWIEPHPCGPFASLEGVGAGQVKEGETRACDHAHGAT